MTKVSNTSFYFFFHSIFDLIARKFSVAIHVCDLNISRSANEIMRKWGREKRCFMFRHREGRQLRDDI